MLIVLESLFPVFVSPGMRTYWDKPLTAQAELKEPLLGGLHCPGSGCSSPQKGRLQNAGVFEGLIPGEMQARHSPAMLPTGSYLCM